MRFTRICWLWLTFAFLRQVESSEPKAELRIGKCRSGKRLVCMVLLDGFNELTVESVDLDEAYEYQSQSGP